MEHQPVLKKRHTISSVWILPILAVLLCGWLLFKSWAEAGITIEVLFDDATGVTPGKTQVMAMGIPFGLVTEMHPDIERRKVRIVIDMDRATEPYLVEDTKFWIVEPEVSAGRVTGLNTILSGKYIGIQRGKSDRPARKFTALSSAPPLPSDTPGLHITLISSALHSLQQGSDIYFRNIKIGMVKSYELIEDDSVRIDCFIEPKYSHLIRTASRFYNAGGFTISGKIPDLKVRIESISSLLTGGIVVETPAALQERPPAQNGDTFELFEDFDAAGYGIPMTLTLASGAGIGEGSTKVLYRGLEAGYVKQITINDDIRRSVTAHILLDPRAQIILKEKTRFWLVKPEVSMDGVHNLNTLLTGPYITFQPGDGEFRDHFELLVEPPAKTPLRAGKTFVLTSSRKPPSENGAPLYYLEKKIGEVIESELSPQRDVVLTSIFIYDEYTDLITKDTVFINSEGVSVDAGFSGFSFHMPPLPTALKGGIDVIRPVALQKMASLGADTTFPLYDDYQSALAEVPALMPQGLYLTLESEHPHSIERGSPILFKQIKVGSVIGLSLAEQDAKVRLTCFIEKRYRHLVTTNSRFHQAGGIRLHGDLSGLSVETQSLQALVLGGIGFFTQPGGTPVKNNARFPVFDSAAAARSADNITIEVRFHEADRLAVGAAVTYRGIQLGTVTRTSFGEDLHTVTAVLSIERGYESFFKEHTKIWLTTPAITINRVENLDNVLFGSSIRIAPGDGKIRHHFNGLDTPPQPDFTHLAGLHLVLEAKHLGSLDLDSPLYYRRVPIGKVVGYDLAYDFKGVLIHVVVDHRYSAIVRENTRFWNVSGLSVKGGVFAGITVSAQSLKAIMSGGIALATPGREEMGPPVQSGFRFVLHDEAAPDWLDWNPDMFIVEQDRPPTPFQ